MSFERAKYEFPIEGIAHHEKADAPAGIYLLDGHWHLAAHDSVAEAKLIERGALLVATLTFALPTRKMDITHLAPENWLSHAQFTTS
jgi:hypothetical protein